MYYWLFIRFFAFVCKLCIVCAAQRPVALLPTKQSSHPFPNTSPPSPPPQHHNHIIKYHAQRQSCSAPTSCSGISLLFLLLSPPYCPCTLQLAKNFVIPASCPHTPTSPPARTTAMHTHSPGRRASPVASAIQTVRLTVWGGLVGRKSSPSPSPSKIGTHKQQRNNITT